MYQMEPRKHDAAQSRRVRRDKIEAAKTASELEFWTEAQIEEMAREHEAREGYAVMCRRQVWA